jgi:hypothetical protein
MIGSVPYLVSLLGERDNVSAGTVMFRWYRYVVCLNGHLGIFIRSVVRVLWSFVFVSLLVLRNMRE